MLDAKVTDDENLIEDELCTFLDVETFSNPGTLSLKVLLEPEGAFTFDI